MMDFTGNVLEPTGPFRASGPREYVIANDDSELIARVRDGMVVISYTDRGASGELLTVDPDEWREFAGLVQEALDG